MPIHDWTNVPAGLFHDFHQSWSINIRNSLNAGLLPTDFMALVEQKSGAKEPDVLAIDLASKSRRSPDRGSLAIKEPPKSLEVCSTNLKFYAAKANRIVIKHHVGRTVAIIEIVSPGNKCSGPALRDFVEKIAAFLNAGIHVLIIDLFPPTKRDPEGIHKAIWDQFGDEDYQLPKGKDRLLVSYSCGENLSAYLQALAVGDEPKDMPLYLTEDFFVDVPLEATYRESWNVTPALIRQIVETGQMPNLDE